MAILGAALLIVAVAALPWLTSEGARDGTLFGVTGGYTAHDKAVDWVFAGVITIGALAALVLTSRAVLSPRPRAARWRLAIVAVAIELLAIAGGVIATHLYLGRYGRPVSVEVGFWAALIALALLGAAVLLDRPSSSA